MKVCPLCGAGGPTVYRGVPDHKYGVPGMWGFRWCPACGVAYLEGPVPPPAVAYPARYRQHDPPHAAALEARGVRSWIRRAVLSASDGTHRRPGSASAFVGRLLAAVPPIRLRAAWGFLLMPSCRREGARVLDFGCGNGRFLAAMRKLGWETYGVEPDDVSRAHASQVADLVVPDLGLLKGTGLRFDVITLNHVIEHLEKPLEVLQVLRTLVAEDGRIGVATPNWGSLGRTLFGRSWYALDPPRHLVLYTKRGLVRTLKRSGFSPERTYTTSIREGPVAFAKSWQYRRGARQLRVARLLGLCVLPLGLIGLGEELVVWATPCADYPPGTGVSV